MRIPRYGPQTELIEEILNHFENPKNKEAWQAFLKDDRRRELFSANQAALGVARLAGREEIFTTIQSRVTNATLDRNSDISLILAWAQGFNVGAVVVADLIGETFTQEQYEILTKPLLLGELKRDLTYEPWLLACLITSLLMKPWNWPI